MCLNHVGFNIGPLKKEFKDRFKAMHFHCKQKSKAGETSEQIFFHKSYEKYVYVIQKMQCAYIIINFALNYQIS